MLHVVMSVCIWYPPFGFEGGMWDLIVLVPDHCFSFYFTHDTDVCQLLPRGTESIHDTDV